MINEALDVFDYNDLAASERVADPKYSSHSRWGSKAEEVSRIHDRVLSEVYERKEFLRAGLYSAILPSELTNETAVQDNDAPNNVTNDSQYSDENFKFAMPLNSDIIQKDFDLSYDLYQLIEICGGVEGVPFISN